MQVVHQLPSEESSPRVHAGKKGRSTRLRRFEAFPWARPQHAYALAHCLASLGISSPLIPAYHHRLALQTGRAQPFHPASPALRSKHRENRDACEERHSSTLPFPNTRQYCIFPMIVCCYLYRKAVKTQIAVPHISCSRLTVIDSGTKLYKTTTTTIPRNVLLLSSVAVIAFLFSPHPSLSALALHVVSSQVARAGEGGVPRMRHACT